MALRGWKQAVSAIPCGDNWTNWRTLPNGLQAKEVRSGSVDSLQDFTSARLPARSAFKEDENSARSVFFMHKTIQRRASEKVVKRLSVFLPSWLDTVGHASSLAQAEMLRHALYLFEQLQESVRAENGDTERSKYCHLTFSWLMKLHSGRWRWYWQCTRRSRIHFIHTCCNIN